MNTNEIVAKVDELSDGQMKEVQAQHRTLLLVRVDGTYKAYVPECPHQGAPLAEGLCCDGHVRCPWHQAVFDAAHGELIEPPALDRLPNYECHIEGEDVVVSIPQEPTDQSPAPAASGHEPDKDERTFAIIGGGAAGLAAAEMLRHEGYRGRIVVFTREADLSYDRTELSKTYLADPDASRPTIRDEGFYAGAGIEVWTNSEVIELDVSSHTVACEQQTPLAFDKVLIATGGVPRKLGAEGEDLGNIFTLRSLADCERLRDAAGGAETAVVVGAGFIGMEVAAALTERGVKVTVVAPEAVPFERVLGERIGRMYQRAHEDRGTAFRLGAGVERFEGEGDAVRRVVLQDGRRVDADMVVVGVGVRPATSFVRGVQTNRNGSIDVGTDFSAGRDVFAAGDVARFPDWRTGEPIRIEHWRLAQQHGRCAARGMLGQGATFADVPFFWTSQHGIITQYVGCAREWDEIVFEGEPGDGPFVAYYLRDGRVHAAAGCESDRKMAAVAEALKRPESPKLNDLRAEIGARVETQNA